MAVASGGDSNADSAISANTSAQFFNADSNREVTHSPALAQKMTLFERTIHLKEHIIRETIKIREGFRLTHIES